MRKQLTVKDYDKLITQVKNDIRKNEDALYELYKERRMLVYRDIKPLERLIRKYPNGYGYPYITILTARKLTFDMYQKILYLFPYTEGGYYGNKGECVLMGEIHFTEEEKDLLDQYGIDYTYANTIERR